MHESKHNRGIIVINCGKELKYSVDGLCEYIADYIEDKLFDHSTVGSKFHPSKEDIKKAVEAYESGKRGVFDSFRTIVSPRLQQLARATKNFPELTAKPKVIPPAAPKLSPEELKAATEAKRKATFEANLALRNLAKAKQAGMVKVTTAPKPFDTAQPKPKMDKDAIFDFDTGSSSIAKRQAALLKKYKLGDSFTVSTEGGSAKVVSKSATKASVAPKPSAKPTPVKPVPLKSSAKAIPVKATPVKAIPAKSAAKGVKKVAPKPVRGPNGRFIKA